MQEPDRSTCEEVFARLDDFVDRELSAGEMRAVEAHLEVCAHCAAEFQQEAEMLNAVRLKLQRIAMPGDLLSKLQQLLAGDGSRRRDPR